MCSFLQELLEIPHQRIRCGWSAIWHYGGIERHARSTTVVATWGQLAQSSRSCRWPLFRLSFSLDIPGAWSRSRSFAHQWCCPWDLGDGRLCISEHVQPASHWGDPKLEVASRPCWFKTDLLRRNYLCIYFERNTWKILFSEDIISNHLRVHFTPMRR